MTEPHQLIPLNKLAAWDGNVRKTAGADTALAELAASIAAHGLLQSLVVRKAPRGKFAVIAGRRRLHALTALAEQGRLDPAVPIACQVIADDANAVELSLAENAVREPMHPADELDAFRELIDRGSSVADVAARFGVAESTVEKRLRLARVSPTVFDAYRQGELGLEEVMAFAVTDDHEAQERLWREAPAWLLDDARSIRAALTEDDIAATDRRVRFVGLKAYQKAGGAVRRDLFSEGDRGVFVLDAVLLESLVLRKLEKAAKAVGKEGWLWVEARPSFGYDELGRYERRWAEPVPLTDDEAAELAAVEREIDASYEIEGDLSCEQQERLDTLTARMEELTDEREEIWPEDTLAIAGAVVSIGSDGEIDVTRGLVRPEDIPEKPRASKSEGADEEPRPTLSAALIESLTAQRSAALSATLIDRPAVALAAIVHLFATNVFGGRRGTCLDILLSPQSFRKAQGSKAVEAIEQARERWGERVPGDPEQLWAWCLEQDQSTLLDLLAFCAGLSVDAVQAKGKADSGRLERAARLAEALQLDLGAWFQPTAESYFGRISKAQTLAALAEAKGAPPAPAWANLKKAELAQLAEREIAGTGWLPELLRPTVFSN
ncbi:MAG: ParB/RepB/Spo0J family partition protein [Acidobacteria bacterium]|nr:ParB/RepB/Spo0J family partition protein [Acidobacteriota bacterium]